MRDSAPSVTTYIRTYVPIASNSLFSPKHYKLALRHPILLVRQHFFYIICDHAHFCYQRTGDIIENVLIFVIAIPISNLSICLLTGIPIYVTTGMKDLQTFRYAGSKFENFWRDNSEEMKYGADTTRAGVNYNCNLGPITIIIT